MRLNWIYAPLLTAAIACPASTQISVYIGTPPPAVMYEEPGPPPGAGFYWIEGYWVPEGRRYKWIKGHWERPPYEGAYWTHPHYDHYPRRLAIPRGTLGPREPRQRPLEGTWAGA